MLPVVVDGACLDKVTDTAIVEGFLERYQGVYAGLLLLRCVGAQRCRSCKFSSLPSRVPSSAPNMVGCTVLCWL